MTLLNLAFLSYQQAGIYRDEETLYRETLAANPDAWMASENLAVLLIAQDPAKNYPEVVRLYRQTLDKNPGDIKARPTRPVSSPCAAIRRRPSLMPTR